MKYTLNESMVGINGIEKISLKEIIEKFLYPKNIKIKIEKNPYTIDFELKYEDFTVYYNIYYYVDKEIPEFHTLSFSLEKLYLNDQIYIKIGEEAKKVISKIKKYFKENYKILNYKYEANEYSGSYYFKDLDLTIFFEKYGRKKIVDWIDISLPYEDNPNILEIGKILKLDTLKNIFNNN